MANSVDPDQTAPIGAVCSGFRLFASILNSSVMLGNYLQQTTSADDIFRCIFSWRFKGYRSSFVKWQLKTLFLAIFNTRLSIVKSVFDCRLSGVVILTCPLASSDPSLFGHQHNIRDGMPYLLSSVLAPFLVVYLRNKS